MRTPSLWIFAFVLGGFASASALAQTTGMKRVPIGYAPRPDGVRLEMTSPLTDGDGFATRITNLDARTVTGPMRRASRWPRADMRALLACALVVGLSLAAHAQAPPAAVTAGSARISADPEQCAKATSVQVWSWSTTWPTDGREAEGTAIRTQLSPDGGRLDIVLTRVAEQSPGNCQWTFTMLPLADYVAVLKTAHGSGGSTAFSLRDTSAVDVTIAPPLVRLSGRIVNNDVPVAGVTIRAMQLPFMVPTPTTMTDEEGRYTLFLAQPGETRLILLKNAGGTGERALGGDVLRLVAGEHTKDFAVKSP